MGSMIILTPVMTAHSVAAYGWYIRSSRWLVPLTCRLLL